MKKLVILLFGIGLIAIFNCSKPCKPILDMDINDMSASVDMAEQIDMFCQINPATELCLDFRGQDR